MKSKIKSLIKKFGKHNPSQDMYGSKTYSQCGEDSIMEFCLGQFGIVKPFFIDIGAYHPMQLNNTYSFYLKGAEGINFEPNPDLYNLFPVHRPRDINIQGGISTGKSGEGILYKFSTPTLNTFSQSEALRIEAMGTYKIVDRVKTQLISVSDLVAIHIKDRPIDVLSIDTEGMDYDILNSFLEQSVFPKVICAETITFEETEKPSKRLDIIDLLKRYGYEVYADTYINTIFLKA